MPLGLIGCGQSDSAAVDHGVILHLIFATEKR
jgi:hypothetical protein